MLGGSGGAHGGGEDGVGEVGGCGDSIDSKGVGGGIRRERGWWDQHARVCIERAVASGARGHNGAELVFCSLWPSSTVKSSTHVPTSTAATSTVSVATAAFSSTSMALPSSAAGALQLYAAMMPVVWAWLYVAHATYIQ